VKLTVVVGSVREGRAATPCAHGSSSARSSMEVRRAGRRPQGAEPADHERAAASAAEEIRARLDEAWSDIVGGSDAFVFVTPEYNYTIPPALVNALDTVYHEWTYKPVGFVSYGGVSGGMRAVQTAKLMVTGFKMMPMVEAVNIPFLHAADGKRRVQEQRDARQGGAGDARRTASLGRGVESPQGQLKPAPT
jgi:NAD(P)H-dependent FMN reductase